ncbi:oxidoreductase [Striga asiatica]|uniref:Oxidoreductase n=1 Tax=Striga asiatica TaxID=4170 RepID=A0A5A7RE38_STRAF|nr:oxidoreductase [Striga asiatica]
MTEFAGEQHFCPSMSMETSPSANHRLVDSISPSTASGPPSFDPLTVPSPMLASHSEKRLNSSYSSSPPRLRSLIFRAETLKIRSQLSPSPKSPSPHLPDPVGPSSSSSFPAICSTLALKQSSCATQGSGTAPPSLSFTARDLLHASTLALVHGLRILKKIFILKKLICFKTCSILLLPVPGIPGNEMMSRRWLIKSEVALLFWTLFLNFVWRITIPTFLTGIASEEENLV